MGLRGVQGLDESSTRSSLDAVQNRDLFLYDLWAAEAGGQVAKNEDEKKRIGEAVYNALFDPSQSYASIIQRCQMDGGSTIDRLTDQFGEDAARKVRYLCDVYLLKEHEGRYDVTDFYKHLFSIRQKLASVQILF
jgi:hypothetical protein